MLRKAAAGLAGLGLIGGAGNGIYSNNGDATVKITDKRTGKVQTVHIGAAGGTGFSCPSGTHDKLAPYDLKAGRIKLTLQQVRRDEQKIEQQYPSDRTPGRVVDHYNALIRREHRLVSAFNTEVDTRNAILRSDCNPAD